MQLLAPTLPIAPYLAQRYGLEQALMLAVVTELVGAWSGQVVVEEQRLYGRALCFTRQYQGQLLSKLSAIGLLQVAPAGNGMVRIELQLELTQNLEPESEPLKAVDESQPSALAILSIFVANVRRRKNRLFLKYTQKSITSSSITFLKSINSRQEQRSRQAWYASRQHFWVRAFCAPVANMELTIFLRVRQYIQQMDLANDRHYIARNVLIGAPIRKKRLFVINAQGKQILE